MDKIKDLLAQLRDKPLQRAVTIDRAAADEAARTVEMAFASETPCDHWFGTLVLSMDGMRTERLAAGAPLLLDHDPCEQVGIVESFSVDGPVARAVCRFSRSEGGEEVFQDVIDGIRKSVSVGFMIHEMHLESSADGTDVYRSDDWEPYEISLVSIPADISVGVGRSTKAAATRAEITSSSENNMETINAPETPVSAVTTAAADDTVARHKDLVEWAGIFGPSAEGTARSVLLRNPNATREDIRVAIVAADNAQPAQLPAEDPAVQAARQGAPRVELARTLPRHGTLKAFREAQSAYRFGQWVLGGPLGIARNAQFCRENGLEIRAMSEGSNEYGGFLVPEEFRNDLIDLREQYGVFRRNAKIVPMMSDTRSDPRRTGGLTAYFVNEADSITASDKSWDRVNLVAKKLAVLARVSAELNEDSVISLADDLANEMAYAFANKEDECGFNGDGSSTYGGIVGAREKLKNLSGTIANIAGLYVGTGNLYSELVLTDFENVVALLPQFADTPNAKWFVHRSFYYGVMLKLALAAGGITQADIVNGQRTPAFLGYPVELTQVMPKTEANSQVCALLGDLSLAASLGSRRDTTITVSEHSRFANDQIEFKGTERFDINVHSVGNAHATAASRVQGPIVGLITAAS